MKEYTRKRHCIGDITFNSYSVESFLLVCVGDLKVRYDDTHLTLCVFFFWDELSYQVRLVDLYCLSVLVLVH